jgi:hypothetical protein
MKLTRFAAAFLVTSIAYLSPVAASGPLEEKTQGSVRYATGGIGADEVAAFKAAAPQYPLELLFAQKASPNDVYLADVKVVVKSASGQVLLDTVSGGPFLLARLPPGKYRIEADSDGVVKQQAVELKAGQHRRVVFVWDAPGG